MKLNVKAFRYLTPEDWRVLAGVEQGTRNHEVVPTSLIAQLSGLRSGASGVNKSISNLAKVGLIAKEKNMKYDGYRLTYGGLDYLAMHSHTKSGSILHLGSQMGVGKESDIYLVMSPSADSTTPTVPEQAILKLHRLGRTSFRSLSNNRAYQGSRVHCTWQQLSKLSAAKEFAAMRALYQAGYPVPRPISHNRHTIVMSLCPGLPLRNVTLEAFGEVEDSLLGSDADVANETAKRAQQKTDRDARIAHLYAAIMEQALALAEVGVIHGDFNEFNILVSNVPDPDDSVPLPTQPMAPILIDFPQITSLSHPQAREYFDRDVECIKSYFRKRYHFESEEAGPVFEEALERRRTSGRRMLDVEVEAMGFNRKMGRELEEAFKAQREAGGDAQDDDEEEAEDVEGEVPGDDEFNRQGEDEKEQLGETTNTEQLLEPETLPPATAASEEAVEFQSQPLTAASLSALAELSLTATTTTNSGKNQQKSKAKNNLKKAAGWAI